MALFYKKARQTGKNELKPAVAGNLHFYFKIRGMGTDNSTEYFREAVRRKYHFYVQISTQFQMMGKGPHRVQLHEQVMQATKEWKLAQQQFLAHVRHHQAERSGAMY